MRVERTVLFVKFWRVSHTWHYNWTILYYCPCNRFQQFLKAFWDLLHPIHQDYQNDILRYRQILYLSSLDLRSGFLFGTLRDPPPPGRARGERGRAAAAGCGTRRGAVRHAQTLVHTLSNSAVTVRSRFSHRPARANKMVTRGAAAHRSACAGVPLRQVAAARGYGARQRFRCDEDLLLPRQSWAARRTAGRLPFGGPRRGA